MLLWEPVLRQALVLHFIEAAAGAVVVVTTMAYVHDVLGRGDTAFALVMEGGGGGVIARRALAPRPEGGGPL